jgi:membrane protein YdbS with pleckstrin-like domain
VPSPVYEALPYVYILVGAIAAAASYFWRDPPWSDLLVVLGLIAVVIGLMLALRRRDYRVQERRYGADFDKGDN